MKNCKLCQLSKVCNDLPGICIILPYVAIVVVVVAVSYLFITQEVLTPADPLPPHIEYR